MKTRFVLRFIKASTLVAAVPIALLPVDVRFSAFVRLAFFLSPLQKWLPSNAGYLDPIVSATDDLLYEILSVIMANRPRFKYDINISKDRGSISREDVRGDESGLLIIGTHAMLMYLVVRHIHDLGTNPSVVAEDTGRRIYGTQVSPAYIGKTSTVLVRVKRVLENRNTVIALCDSAQYILHADPVDLGSGPFWVSKALVRVADRAGARIVFVHPRVRRGRLELIWDRPPPDERSPEAVMAGFASFLAVQVRSSAAGAPSRRQATRAPVG